MATLLAAGPACFRRRVRQQMARVFVTYREMHHFMTEGGIAHQTIGAGKPQNISVPNIA